MHASFCAYLDFADWVRVRGDQTADQALRLLVGQSDVTLLVTPEHLVDASGGADSGESIAKFIREFPRTVWADVSADMIRQDAGQRLVRIAKEMSVEPENLPLTSFRSVTDEALGTRLSFCKLIRESLVRTVRAKNIDPAMHRLTSDQRKRLELAGEQLKRTAAEPGREEEALDFGSLVTMITQAVNQPITVRARKLRQKAGAELDRDWAEIMGQLECQDAMGLVQEQVAAAGFDIGHLRKIPWNLGRAFVSVVWPTITEEQRAERGMATQVEKVWKQLPRPPWAASLSCQAAGERTEEARQGLTRTSDIVDLRHAAFAHLVDLFRCDRRAHGAVLAGHAQCHGVESVVSSTREDLLEVLGRCLQHRDASPAGSDG